MGDFVPFFSQIENGGFCPFFKDWKIFVEDFVSGDFVQGDSVRDTPQPRWDIISLSSHFQMPIFQEVFIFFYNFSWESEIA